MLSGSFHCDSVSMMFYSSLCKRPCRKFGLDANTIDFVGHSLALHRDDRFLTEPALDTVKRVKV